MSTKLSTGAVQLLDVITKMPGHFREDYMTTAGIKRAMWNRLSGELRRTGNAYAERTTINRNGKETTDFKWFAGSKPTGKSRARKTSKTPPAVRRGTARATKRTTAVKSKTEKVEPVAPKAVKSLAKAESKFSAWKPEELELLHDLWKQGLTDKQIEAKLGRTAWAIRGQRKAKRWVAVRGKNKPQKVTKTRKSEEPTYKVTIVEPLPSEEEIVQTPQTKTSFTKALLGFETIIDDKVRAEVSSLITSVHEIYQDRMKGLEKRISTLEESLNKNSEADQATINVIGELEKTLSALKGNL
ncbi:hypothetical protein N9N26_00635 [Candidatus Poseidoniales archaeon]|jgi:hypothetical protein|nr:hypothetical protein [Candidatus Poseidoniales archaeon]